MIGSPSNKDLRILSIISTGYYGQFKKKMALFLDILSTQEAKFQIWYLSEFLVVLWSKYVTLNKTTLGIHKGQTKFFVKISIGLCVQIW